MTKITFSHIGRQVQVKYPGAQSRRGTFVAMDIQGRIARIRWSKRPSRYQFGDVLMKYVTLV